MDKMTLIVPCYNEEEVLPILYRKLEEVRQLLSDVSMEYLFVDDGSKDGTLEELVRLLKKDKKVKYIAFSRNFGKEAAMYAGLEHAAGDFVAILDADLQDPPELLVEMYRILKEEPYDAVATRRVTRKGEPPIRSFFARQFYHIMNRISNVELMDGARDFRLMTRTYVNAVLSLKEYNRFSKGLFGWVGFRTKWLEFENVERAAGETKWSFWKLFAYSLEGITSFSTAPLGFAAFMGVLFCIFAFALIIFTIVRKALFGDPTSGWPSLVCIISLVSGVQLFCLGIVGQYLAKTYMEVKRRPIYLIKEEI